MPGVDAETPRREKLRRLRRLAWWTYQGATHPRRLRREVQAEIGALAGAERELEGRLGFLRRALPDAVAALQNEPRRAARHLAEEEWDEALRALEAAHGSLARLRACLAADHRTEELAGEVSELPHRLGIAALGHLSTLQGLTVLVEGARGLLRRGEVFQAEFRLDLCRLQLGRATHRRRSGGSGGKAAAPRPPAALQTLQPTSSGNGGDPELEALSALAEKGYDHLARNLADDLATLRAGESPGPDAASLLPSITATLAELTRLENDLAAQESSAPPAPSRR